MNILVATPCLGQVSANYMLSLLQTIKSGHEEGYEIGVSTVSNCSLVALARNTLASRFLKDTNVIWDKLFFIDSDQSWSYEQAKLLFKSERKIIGGTYSVKKLPLSLNFKPLPQHAKYFPEEQKTPEAYSQFLAAEADETGEVAVECLPTGFMLIDRSVLEFFSGKAPVYSYRDLVTGEMTQEWDFFKTGAQGGIYLPEDFFFSNMCSKYGFQPYLQTKAVVKHEGNYVFGQ